MKQKVLTTSEAQNLKWFCRNVVGCRQEFYAVLDKTTTFDARIERLEKTCDMIERFFGEQLVSLYEPETEQETNK